MGNTWVFFGRAKDWREITPSDSAANAFDGLFIGTGNTDLTVESKAGNTANFKNISNAEILPLKTAKVHATNTTCTDIVGLIAE